jgi:site-specific DNA recombinase
MNVGLFIRVSTVDQAKGESPKIHEERGRLYAESKGWKVVKIYDLKGVSGKSTRYHSETEKMLADIKDGEIQGLIFSQLSRLARNTEELLYYANYFEKFGASLISLNESIDTSSSSGKFFYTILGALSTWERENNLDRIMASIETRRTLGKFTGGQVSYGYKIENAKVVIHDKEAPVRILMYDLFLKHRRRTTVARLLNEMGYRTRANKPWSDVTVDRLLKNSDAKGIRKSNYRREPTEDNPSFTKPKEEWLFDECPALISEEKWNSVNTIIKEQENSLLTKPLNQRTHLFTGYLFCDNGHKMSVQSKTSKYSCPICKVRLEIDILESIFKSRIEKFLISAIPSVIG